MKTNPPKMIFTSTGFGVKRDNRFYAKKIMEKLDMNKPTDEEINRVIAEFMGWTGFTVNLHNTYAKDPCSMGHKGLDLLPGYTESLDACWPVIEKLHLGDTDVGLSIGHTGIYYSNIWTDKEVQYCGFHERYRSRGAGSDKSPSRALAMAIYEAIKNG